MRNLKRALSLALASVMLLGMMVVGSGASYADVTSEENQEAIEVLQAIGVMVGDNNGNFNPDALVNREQMATIMCQLLDYTVSTYTGTTNFTDVSAWALPYVEACYANGIIAGYSDTQFGGTDNVTTAQAALMIMKALGYFQEAGDFGGDWVVSTVRQGAQIQLFDGVTNGANEALTRNDVAQMVLNGLKADSVEITSHDLVSDGNGGFTTKANYTSRAQVSDWATLIDNDSTNPALQLGEELFRGDLVETGGDENFGRPSTLWTFEGDEVGTYADTPDGVVVVDESTVSNVSLYLDDVLTGGDYHNLKDGTNEKQNNYVDLTASATAKTAVYVNGDAQNGVSGHSTDPATIPVYAGDTVEIFKNQYGFVTTVVVARYELAEVDLLNDNVSSSDSAKGTEYYVDLVDLNGSAVGIGTYKDNDIAGFDADIFAEGSMVAVAMNSDEEIIDSYALKTVSGGISAYKINSTNSPYVIVDGTTYPLNNDALSNGSSNDSNVDFVDGTYNVYLDANGYAIGVEGTYKVAIEDVYYVTGVVRDSNGLYSDASYYAQGVSLADGTVKEIQLEASSYYALLTAPGAGNLGFVEKGTDGKFYVYVGTDAAKYDRTGAGTYTDQGDNNGDYAQYATMAAAVDAATNSATYNNELISDKVGLYSFTDNDKDTAKGSKSNNGKLTAEAYAGDDDDLFYVTGSLPSAGLKKSDTSTTIGGAKLYLNDQTKYILVEADKSDIDVKVYTGGANVEDDGITAYVMYTKSGTAKVAAYVLLAAGDIKGQTDISDVVYLASTPNVKVNDGWRTDLYLMDGTVLEDVTVTGTTAPTGRTFYTYTEEDGLYTLDSYTDEPADVADYEDGTGAIEDKLIDSIYNDGLTLVYTGNSIVDVDASAAKIVDTRSASDRDADAYTTEITTLAQLSTAVKRGAVLVDVFLDDGEVKLIAVISMTTAVKSTSQADLADVGAGDLLTSDDGMYAGTGAELIAAGATATAGTYDAIAFKFTAPISSSAVYTLTILDSDGNEYYVESATKSWAKDSGHCFFLDIDGVNVNGTGSTSTTKGSWTSGGYSSGAMDAGSYTYTITCDGVTIQSGSFTIA